jgi:hypothetical protein
MDGRSVSLWICWALKHPSNAVALHLRWQADPGRTLFILNIKLEVFDFDAELSDLS